MDLLNKARKHQDRAEYWAAESRNTSRAMLTAVQFILAVGAAGLAGIAYAYFSFGGL